MKVVRYLATFGHSEVLPTVLFFLPEVLLGVSYYFP
jgi:hypothetical protein